MAALEGEHRSVCVAASTSWETPRAAMVQGQRWSYRTVAKSGEINDVCFSGLLFKPTQLCQVPHTKLEIQTISSQCCPAA